MDKIILLFMIITILVYINVIKLSKSHIDKAKFENKWANMLYVISYSYPFSILLKEDRKFNKREEKLEEQIFRLNLSTYFNLRSFLTLRFLLLIISVVMFVVLLILSSIKNPLVIIPFLIVAYIPDLYIRITESKYKKFYYDEVPILQLFMISLIKSNSTVEEILFAFAKMNTFHKDTFEKAYRMSIRNKREALDFLENKFSSIAFGGSFNVLNNMYEYSKESSLRILKSNLKKLEMDTINQMRQEELGKFSFAQVSMAAPFSIAVLLGAVPLIYYGTNSMIEMMGGL